MPPVEIDLSLAENKVHSLEASIQVNKFREVKNKYENQFLIVTDETKLVQRLSLRQKRKTK